MLRSCGQIRCDYRAEGCEQSLMIFESVAADVERSMTAREHSKQAGVCARSDCASLKIVNAGWE